MPSLNVKDYLLAGACGLALFGLVLGGVQSWRLERAEEARRTAEARELQAKVQATLNHAGAEINDRRSSNINTAYRKSEEARRAIQTPDYDAALREYGAGIDRVREAGRAGLSEPDAGGSGEG